MTEQLISECEDVEVKSLCVTKKKSRRGKLSKGKHKESQISKEYYLCSYLTALNPTLSHVNWDCTSATAFASVF